jgi:tetratricopeptide (TPR) repeat protein
MNSGTRFQKSSEELTAETRYFEMIRSLKKFIKRYMTDKEKAVIMYSIAQVFLCLKKCYNALSWIDKAIDLDPDTASYWVFKGDLLQTTRFSRYTESLNAYHVAAGIQPADIGILMRTGKVYEKTRELEKAIKIYDKALEINPSDPAPWYSKGYALYKLFYRKKREQRLIECSKMLSDDIAFHDEILRTLQHVLDLEPGNTDTLYLIAQLLTNLEKYDEALQYYDTALQYYKEEDNSPLQIWYSKAEVLEKVGRVSEALELYERYYAELQKEFRLFMQKRSSHLT